MLLVVNCLKVDPSWYITVLAVKHMMILEFHLSWRLTYRDDCCADFLRSEAQMPHE